MTETFNLDPRDIEITGLYNNRIVRSQGGIVQTRRFPGGYWRISGSIPSYSRYKYEDLLSFLHERGGSAESFYVTIPRLGDTQASYSGQILVNGAGQTGNTLAIDGADANTLILRKGDYFKFNSTDKVYKVTRDCTTTGAGTGTVYLAPNIRTANDGDSLIYKSVPFLVINTSSEVGISLDLFQRGGISFNFEEAFQS